MKKHFILGCICLTVCSLCFASPATDYSFVREFGEEGVNSNQFYQIAGIAVDRFDNVFLTDSGMLIDGDFTNDYPVVKRWSIYGQYETSWPMGGWSGMSLPAGIDCSCDGDPFYVSPFYIISPYGKNIEHSTPDGAFLENFPGMSFGVDGFYFIDVAISADGFAYGTYYNNYQPEIAGAYGVAKFHWDGTNWITDKEILFTNTFEEISPIAHAIDADPWRGKVYVSMLAEKSGIAAVKVFDMDLNFEENLMLWNYGASPHGLAVDNRDGSFFVCEAVSNIIQKFSPTGELITQWGGYGSEPSQFDTPTDLDVDMNGYVYVADFGNNRVQVFAPPMEGNLNFIVYKSKAIVKWKTKTKGKNRDVIMAKGFVAVDALTNLFGGPGSKAMVDLPISFWYGEVPIISNMPPTKTNNKGSKALYKPDKDHKAKLIYKEKGALIKFMVKLKKADIDGPLGINDVDTTALPPWLWVRAQISLSTNYFGVHYMRLEHKNKVGKVYKAIKK